MRVGAASGSVTNTSCREPGRARTAHRRYIRSAPSTTISELSASIVVYSGGLETLPIAIYRLVDTGRLGLASAYGAVLVLLILVPVGVATKLLKVNLFSVK
mgnify:CR=1 FL=1